MGKLEKLVEELRGELLSGKFLPGARFPSEYRLAEQYNINKSTANKAVLRLTLEGLLKRGRRGAGTIVNAVSVFPEKHLVFVGTICHPYYAQVLQGLQKAALLNNCLVSVVAPPAEQLNEYLEKIAVSSICGIISNGYGAFECESLPIIYLEEDSKVGNNPNNFVTSNSYDGAYQIMREVITRGHRDVVIFFRHDIARKRLQGFHDAMRDAGISDIQDRTFWAYDNTIYETALILKKITKAYPHFSAIAAGSDDDIYRMIAAAEKQNLDWRGKIAMTGFGNLPGISDMFPIASVDQHPSRLGFEAFRQMMVLLEDNSGRDIHEYVDVEICGTANIPILSRR